MQECVILIQCWGIIIWHCYGLAVWHECYGDIPLDSDFDLTWLNNIYSRIYLHDDKIFEGKRVMLVKYMKYNVLVFKDRYHVYSKICK